MNQLGRTFPISRYLPFGRNFYLPNLLSFKNRFLCLRASWLLSHTVLQSFLEAAQSSYKWHFSVCTSAPLYPFLPLRFSELFRTSPSSVGPRWPPWHADGTNESFCYYCTWPVLPQYHLSTPLPLELSWASSILPFCWAENVLSKHHSSICVIHCCDSNDCNSHEVPICNV